MKVIDLTGERFGRLTVIRQIGKRNNRVTWLCKCDCGNEKIVKGVDLKRGHVKSCGCLKKEFVPKSKTHGKRSTRLYTIWNMMKQRCENPKSKSYKNYGGRGIRVCNEWKNNFQSFYDWAINNGYNENLNGNDCTIDRISVNGNYEPTNCRWVNKKFQANNKRNNHFISYRGETHTIAQWEEKLGINNRVFYQRLKLGWGIDETIETPVRKTKIKYKFTAKGTKAQLKALKEYLIQNGLI